MHLLNNKIDKTWLNVSLNTYKVRCKDLVLSMTRFQYLTEKIDKITLMYVLYSK